MANSNGKDFIHKCVDTINNMIWKYNIVTIDRVVLCLALRTQEGNEAQVCFLIIQLLLLKTSELRNRIQEFCKENHPDHWKQNNWLVYLMHKLKYPSISLCIYVQAREALAIPSEVSRKICTRWIGLTSTIAGLFLECLSKIFTSIGYSCASFYWIAYTTCASNMWGYIGSFEHSLQISWYVGNFY